MNRSVSVTGKPLNPNDKAIPCGKQADIFPLGKITGRNLQNGAVLNITTEDIVSSLSEPFSNVDLDSQWVNITDPRFRNWMEISPSKETKKLWGLLKPPIIGSFQFELRRRD